MANLIAMAIFLTATDTAARSLNFKEIKSLVNKFQISEKQGTDSKFEAEANLKVLVPKSKRSLILI